MKLKKFDKDPYFSEWVYASSNYRQRRWGIRAFCRFAERTPSELIHERQEDLKSDEPLFRVRAENRLRKFMKKLEDEEAGYNKRRNLFNLIKNFYSHFNLDLNMKRSDAPKGESGKVYPMTKELLQRVLAVADVRERALVLLMKDTGQAVAEISSLTLAHLGSDGENLSLEKAPIPIKLTRKKTKSKIQTFVGEEAMEALNVYFDLRRRGTTDLYKGRWRGKKGLQPEVFTAESPVIARKSGGHLSSETISYIIKTLIKKAGIKADVRAHSIRRFFETTFENPEIGMHPAWIKRMMGHKPTQNERAYSHPTTKQLREAYQKGYKFLRVQEASVDQERLNQLEKEVKDRDVVVDALTNNIQKGGEDIELLKAQMKELRELIIPRENRLWEELERAQRMVARYSLIVNENVDLPEHPIAPNPKETLEYWKAQVTDIKAQLKEIEQKTPKNSS